MNLGLNTTVLVSSSNIKKDPPPDQSSLWHQKGGHIFLKNISSKETLKIDIQSIFPSFHDKSTILVRYILATQLILFS